MTTTIIGLQMLPPLRLFFLLLCCACLTHEVAKERDVFQRKRTRMIGHLHGSHASTAAHAAQHRSRSGRQQLFRCSWQRCVRRS